MFDKHNFNNGYSLQVFCHLIVKNLLVGKMQEARRKEKEKGLATWFS